MQLKDLMAANITLSKHYNDTMPAALAYKLMKFVEAVQPDTDFYQKKVNEIVGRCGEKDEKGEFVRDKSGGVRIISDKKEEFITAMAELDRVEVEKPAFSVTLAELSEMKLTPQDMLNLEPFIKESEE